MAVPPCRSYFFELTHSISPLTVSESRGYFLFFSIANPPRRVNARGRPSVSKKPRRVCRPQAAKHCNHFLSRHVRERKYFSGCKCGLCAPPAYKVCAQQPAGLLSGKPSGLSRQAKPPAAARAAAGGTVRRRVQFSSVPAFSPRPASSSPRMPSLPMAWRQSAVYVCSLMSCSILQASSSAVLASTPSSMRNFVSV